MKTTKPHRRPENGPAERRARRGTKRSGRHDDRWEVRSRGGSVDPKVLRRTVEAFDAVDLGAGWDAIAPMVLPLLKRVTHAFPSEATPIHLHVPPGVWAGFGIDVGPAWAHVSRPLMERWGIDEATLLGAALENLRRRAAEEPPRIEEVTFEDARITVAQAQGWGSALILAPDRLRSIIGDAPRVLLTPVRNALVALPEAVDVEVAVAIWQAFSEGSDDELDVDPLRWTGSSVLVYPADTDDLTPVL
jgi:hypothetical protein